MQAWGWPERDGKAVERGGNGENEEKVTNKDHPTCDRCFKRVRKQEERGQRQKGGPLPCT